MTLPADDDVLALAENLPPLTDEELRAHAHQLGYNVLFYGNAPFAPDQRPAHDIRSKVEAWGRAAPIPVPVDPEATR